jgi:hypothetical protein
MIGRACPIQSNIAGHVSPRDRVHSCTASAAADIAGKAQARKTRNADALFRRRRVDESAFLLITVMLFANGLR